MINVNLNVIELFLTDVYKTLWGGQLCLSGKSWKLHVHILAVELD